MGLFTLVAAFGLGAAASACKPKDEPPRRPVVSAAVSDEPVAEPPVPPAPVEVPPLAIPAAPDVTEERAPETIAEADVTDDATAEDDPEIARMLAQVPSEAERIAK